MIYKIIQIFIIITFIMIFILSSNYNKVTTSKINIYNITPVAGNTNLIK